MSGLDFDLNSVADQFSGVAGQVQGALSGAGLASMIRLPRTFPTTPAAALGNLAARYGFPVQAAALSTGRVDDLVNAAGQGAIGLLMREGVRRVNLAIDGFAGKFLELLGGPVGDPPPVGEVLLILGDFAFMVGAIAHQSIKRTNEYRWAKQERLLHVPARQFVGVGDERFELDGYLLPHYTGGANALDQLRAGAARGEPQNLIDHFGAVYGRYVVESIEETGTELDIYGQPRKVDFRMALAAYGEDADDPLGDLVGKLEKQQTAGASVATQDGGAAQ